MKIAKEYKKDSLTGHMVRPGELYAEISEEQKIGGEQKEQPAEQQTNEQQKQQQTEQEAQQQKKKTK